MACDCMTQPAIKNNLFQGEPSRGSFFKMSVIGLTGGSLMGLESAPGQLNPNPHHGLLKGKM